MKHFVINNFLNEENCKNLIKDVEQLISKDDFYKYHGNRNDLASSSLAYNDLLLGSENWKNLANQLCSIEFFKECCNKLELDSNKFCTKNYFKLTSPTPNEKKYKIISNLKANLIPNRSLIKFLIYRIYRDLYRKIKFSKIFNINKKPLELLYNYAKAGNGYWREIHRDSDNRLIVFILYFNGLPEEGEGGTLDFYKLVKKDKNLATPAYSSCEKIKSIKPEVGKLVVFLNGGDSYHAVSTMKNYNNFRHFIYGGFTLLSGRNPYIKNKSRLGTNFHNYE